MSMFKYQQSTAKNIQIVDSFEGLNSRFRISENEFSDIFNMTSDDYPVLSTRKKRAVLKYRYSDIDKVLSALPAETVSILFIDDVPAILTSDGDFFYKEKHIKVSKNNRKMLRIGNQVYIYPEGVLISLPKSDDDSIKIENTFKTKTNSKELFQNIKRSIKRNRMKFLKN